MTSHTIADAPRLERRAFPLWSTLSLLLPLAAVLAVAAANGGFFATAFGWTALAFAWVTIVAVVLVVPRWGTLDACWVLAVGALCVFTFCSAIWAGSAGIAIDQGQRAVVYATAVAGALLLLRRRDLERWLSGLVLGAAAICFYSLATRLFADHFGAFNANAGYRLFVPIGYWNALGIFAGLAALLAFGIAVTGRSSTLRILAAVALVVLLPTLYYTYSRGSWAALLVGLVVTLLYSPWRERLFVGLLVFGPLPALAVWLASRPAALTDRSASITAASHAGHRLAFELAALGLLQAAVAAVYATAGGRLHVSRAVRIGVRVVVAIALLAAIAGIFDHYGSPSTLAHRTYHSFTAPPTGGQNLNSRLFSLSNNGRTVLWHSAWDEFRAHPVVGSGAGSFQRWWLAHRTSGYFVQDTHNLYAQTLGELGIVGGALLALFLGLPLVAAFRARWHPLAAAALGVYVAYLVHCIVDWDWQVPAVTLLALFAGAALVVAARGQDRSAAEAARAEGADRDRLARSRRRPGRLRRADREHRARAQREGAPRRQREGRRRTGEAGSSLGAVVGAGAAQPRRGEDPRRRQARRPGRSSKRSCQGSRRLGDVVRSRLRNQRARTGSCRRTGAGTRPGRPGAHPARAPASGQAVGRSAVVVREQRHRQTRGPAKQHRTRDRSGAEATANLVQRSVQHRAVVALERQAELAREIVIEVGDRDADQRQARAAPPSAEPQRTGCARPQGRPRSPRSSTGVCASATRARSPRNAA